MTKFKSQRASCAAAIAAVLWALSGAASAAENDSLIKQLMEKLDKQDQQLQELKHQVQVLQAAPVDTTAKQSAGTAPEIKYDHSVWKANPLIDTPDHFRIVDTDKTALGVYGVVELAVDTNSTGGPYISANTELPSGGVTNKRWTGLDRPWISANRWGINGSHVLDAQSNTLLIMRLESEFYLATGNMDTPGTLFNRDAWIGFASPLLGKLTFGRQDTLARDVNKLWANPSFDPRANYSEGDYYDNDVIVQTKNYFESPTGSRADGEIMWKKQWGTNWLTYMALQTAGFRNSQSGATSNVVETGTGVGGDEQEKAIGFGYNSTGNALHASGSYTTVKNNGFQKSVSALGGNIFPTPWLRLNGGVIRASIEQPTAVGDRKDTVYALSTQIFPGEKFEYVLGLNHTHAHNAGMDANGSTLFAFDPTDQVSATSSGNLVTEYALVYYRWDPQTLFYVAADHSYQTGDYSNQSVFQTHSGITQFGVGVRYGF